MPNADPELAWAVRQAMTKRRSTCDQSGTHIIADDLTHVCSHIKNTGEIDVLIKDNVFYKRCNLPFCPHKDEVHAQATAIHK
jgi:hypothetical protein